MIVRIDSDGTMENIQLHRHQTHSFVEEEVRDAEDVDVSKVPSKKCRNRECNKMSGQVNFPHPEA